MIHHTNIQFQFTTHHPTNSRRKLISLAPPRMMKFNEKQQPVYQQSLEYHPYDWCLSQ
jgi:hypothetical protein